MSEGREEKTCPHGYSVNLPSACLSCRVVKLEAALQAAQAEVKQLQVQRDFWSSHANEYLAERDVLQQQVAALMEHLHELALMDDQTMRDDLTMHEIAGDMWQADLERQRAIQAERDHYKAQAETLLRKLERAERQVTGLMSALRFYHDPEKCQQLCAEDGCLCMDPVAHAALAPAPREAQP